MIYASSSKIHAFRATATIRLREAFAVASYSFKNIKGGGGGVGWGVSNRTQVLFSAPVTYILTVFCFASVVYLYSF